MRRLLLTCALLALATPAPAGIFRRARVRPVPTAPAYRYPVAAPVAAPACRPGQACYRSR